MMTHSVLKNRGKMHAIGGVEDHIHILIETPKDIALSDLMREIKSSSTHWLKGIDKVEYNAFEWQTGYAAFSVSHTNVEEVKNYIFNQEKHHQKLTFKEELEVFLQKLGYQISVDRSLC